MSRFLLIEVSGDNPALHVKALKVALRAMETNGTTASGAVVPVDPHLRKVMDEQRDLAQAHVRAFMEERGIQS